MSAKQLTGVSQIEIAQLMVLKQAVKLELVGLKHSSGKSMWRVVARELGLSSRTSHDDVIGALNKEINARLKAMQEAGPTHCPKCGSSCSCDPAWNQ